MPAWLDALHAAPACDSYPEARAFARTLWTRFGHDPAFDGFAAAVHLWQTDFNACGKIREAADAGVRGDVVSPEANSLLKAVSDAGAVGPPLYRGFAEPFPYWTVVANYAPGTRVDFALASFTSDYVRALEFAWLTQEAIGGTEVVYLLRNNANAVRIELLAPDHIHWREREWLTGGRFVVTSVEYHHDSERVEVHLTQEGWFNAG